MTSLVPNVISHHAVISACEKEQRWERAQLLLAQMEARGLVSNEISYKAATSACEEEQRWDRTPLLRAQMCVKEPRWVCAMLLLAQWEGRSSAPNVISYNAAMLACEKEQWWERTLLLMVQMEERSFAPSVISCHAATSVWPQNKRPGGSK